MERTVKKLLENKATISREIFNVKPYSSEAYSIQDDIDKIVSSTIRVYGDDIDLDDSGLDGNPDIKPDRTITYRVNVYRYDKNKHEDLPLKKKEISDIERAILEKVVLPAEDEYYEYEIKAEILGISLIINFYRRRKVEW